MLYETNILNQISRRLNTICQIKSKHAIVHFQHFLNTSTSVSVWLWSNPSNPPKATRLSSATGHCPPCWLPGCCCWWSDEPNRRRLRNGMEWRPSSLGSRDRRRKVSPLRIHYSFDLASTARSTPLYLWYLYTTVEYGYLYRLVRVYRRRAGGPRCLRQRAPARPLLLLARAPRELCSLSAPARSSLSRPPAAKGRGAGTGHKSCAAFILFAIYGVPGLFDLSRFLPN
jgi:hypothetical protein